MATTLLARWDDCAGCVIVHGTYAHGTARHGTARHDTAHNRTGVVPVGDMTPEAAVANLHYLLGTRTRTSPDTIRAMLRRSLCGEMS